MRYFIALLYLLFCSLAPAFAAEVKNATIACSAADVSITTTAETVVATGEATEVPGTSFRVRVRTSGIMTTSANSTTYTVRIRRGTVTGTALGDAIAETIKVTAGGTEAFYLEAVDDRQGDFASVTYVGTITMAGADGTTTSKWACLSTDILR